MAVLKRFSYDNIVEHNPTAPDPVEGGGGGSSCGLFIINGTHSVDQATGTPSLELDKSHDDIMSAAADGLVPVIVASVATGGILYCMCTHIIYGPSGPSGAQIHFASGLTMQKAGSTVILSNIEATIYSSGEVVAVNNNIRVAGGSPA